MPSRPKGHACRHWGSLYMFKLDAFCRLAHSKSTFQTVSFCFLPPISFTSLLTAFFSLHMLPWGLSDGLVLAAGQSPFVSAVASPRLPSSFSERSTRSPVLNTSTAASRCEFTHHRTSLPPAATQRLTAARLALFHRGLASVRLLAMGRHLPHIGVELGDSKRSPLAAPALSCPNRAVRWSSWSAPGLCRRLEKGTVPQHAVV